MPDRHKHLSDERATGKQGNALKSRSDAVFADDASGPEKGESSAIRQQRHYQMSSNRSSATHKLRYVESGGGAGDGNCRVCKPTPKPR